MMVQRQQRIPTPDEKVANRLLKAIQMMISTSQEGERNSLASSIVSLFKNNGITHSDLKLFVVKDEEDFLASKLKELDEAYQELDDALSREEEMFDQMQKLEKQLKKRGPTADENASVEQLKQDFVTARKQYIEAESILKQQLQEANNRIAVLIAERDELQANLDSSEADLVVAMRKLAAVQKQLDSKTKAAKPVVVKVEMAPNQTMRTMPQTAQPQMKGIWKKAAEKKRKQR